MDMSIITRLRSLQPAADVADEDEADLTEPLVEVDDEEAMKPERLVNDLIDYSIALNASDLFFAVDENEVDITLRHLGVIRQVARLPGEVGLRCIAYVHGAAGMRYADKRHPQDGRWILHRPQRASVDVRLSSVPTLYGESLALRMLRRDSELMKLQHLGLTESQLADMQSLLAAPSGLILVTGPTGSGKTTTLYACMHALNNGRRKIHTIEDPVEYAVPGLRQTQVDDAHGAGFAEMLRAILRQGPDVIMIGEIRDAATAETAVLAANSGQLVLATLHAPRAAAAVHTMLGLGTAPYLLCTSLLGVIGQRLVRVLNRETRVPIDLSGAPHTFDEVRQWLEPGEGETVYTAPGPSANNEAYWYRGQTCVFEIMLTSPMLRKMITELQPASALAQAAIGQGMIDLRRATLLKIAKGITSFDEMQCEIPSGTLWVDE
jgi:type II secretory ATPase GspE/PulE/Tfp pilus assembly ATPase PilB-like protein